MNFVLPSNSAALRPISSYNECQDPSFSLSHELIWAFLRVFEKEILNNRKLKLSLKEIRARYDFNLPDAFSTIDLQGLGYLDVDSIYSFFIKNKLKITDNELLYLFRKFDKDQDGRISPKEFENEMNLLGINRSLPKPLNSSTKKPYKPSSSSKKSLHSNRTHSPLLKTPVSSRKGLENSIRSIKDSINNRKKESYEGDSHFDSPERVSVSRRRLYSNYQFNQKDSDEVLNRESPLKSLEQRISKQEALLGDITLNNSLRKEGSAIKTGNFPLNMKNSPFKEKFLSSNPLYNTSPYKENKEKALLTSFDEKELVKALKLQIELDREIEATKNDLSLQSDFTLLEAYKSFDYKGDGLLSLNDLNKAFKRLDIYLSDEEIFVFIKRFGKTKENSLRYSDFCDIFTPRAEEFQHILASRSPGLFRNEVFKI